MNPPNESLLAGDGRLGTLLRAARPMPELPPGFAAAVWRRLERAELPDEPAVNGLDRVVAWLLRPRLALAGAIALACLGASLGAHEGVVLSKQAAQARYVAAVSPLTTGP
jgi:hypothetical protein